MTERTSYIPGTPSWVDVSSPDTDASAAFYGALSHIPEDAPERGMVSTFIMQHIEGLYRQS